VGSQSVEWIEKQSDREGKEGKEERKEGRKEGRKERKKEPNVFHCRLGEPDLARPDELGFGKLAIGEEDELKVELEDASFAEVFDRGEDGEGREGETCSRTHRT
jgi:hypothetical protein